MAQTSKFYGQFPLNAFSKLVNDLEGGGTTIKVALLTSAYTLDQDNHVAYDDISAYEVVGAGYTAGGKALTTKDLTYAARVTTFDADDTSWAAATIADVWYAVLYDDTEAADADKMLIGIICFGEAKSAAAATFQIIWSESGIFTVTVGA